MHENLQVSWKMGQIIVETEKGNESNSLDGNNTTRRSRMDAVPHPYRMMERCAWNLKKSTLSQVRKNLDVVLQKDVVAVVADIYIPCYAILKHDG